MLQQPHHIESGHGHAARGHDTEDFLPDHGLCETIDRQRPVDGNKVVEAGNIGGGDLDRLLGVHQVTGDTEDLVPFVLLLRGLKQLHGQRGEAHCGVILGVGLHPVHAEIRRNP